MFLGRGVERAWRKGSFKDGGAQAPEGLKLRVQALQGPAGPGPAAGQLAGA